ncbi:MAG: signal recognition particle protein [Deltaproteobacteria bacterium]|jgi:signal recognition particle subunit SRP54|nr:MAG: signal recognition particle protein [Deltaproteobacteria bacterium]
MFENLSEKFQGVLKKMRGHGRISEGNIEEALREVRLALLEADVNYKVVKEFTAAVKERALGAEVLSSLSPDQHFIKIVHDELAKMMGGEGQDLDLARRPPVPVMLVGLQGSGKTTSCGKLALHLQKRKRRPFLVPADVYRPAAIEQLKVLGARIGVPVFDSDPSADPVEICRQAVRQADLSGLDTVLLDTAGRLHVDEELMEELRRIREAVEPGEILLVADAMTGQDAVNVARAFHEKVGLTGVLLTKMDGDARGGAALSIRAVTGAPVKFVGVGEKHDALEAFYPDRMASRILGMGDILTLAEKAQETVDTKKAEELERKIRRSEFTLEDFRDQLISIRKMGSIEDLLGMIPGMGGKMKELKAAAPDEKELARVVAIIDSMTREERGNAKILNGSRRKRIAEGSGTTVQDVNRLLKNFQQAEGMLRRFSKGAGKKRGKGMPFF